MTKFLITVKFTTQRSNTIYLPGDVVTICEADLKVERALGTHHVTGKPASNLLNHARELNPSVKSDADMIAQNELASPWKP